MQYGQNQSWNLSKAAEISPVNNCLIKEFRFGQPFYLKESILTKCIDSNRFFFLGNVSLLPSLREYIFILVSIHHSLTSTFFFLFPWFTPSLLPFGPLMPSFRSTFKPIFLLATFPAFISSKRPFATCILLTTFRSSFFHCLLELYIYIFSGLKWRK